MAAVVLALVYNSFPVSFGAVGIPIWGGIWPAVSTYATQITAFAGADGNQVFSKIVAEAVTLIHGPMSLIICIFMQGFITRFFGPHKSWKEGFAVWPFCIVAAVLFCIPYYIICWNMGPECASLGGGIVSLAGSMFLASKGFCMPKGDPWTFGDQKNWDKKWTGEIAVKEGFDAQAKMSQIRAWCPYILIALILMLTRFHWFGVNQPALWLQSHAVFHFNNILGYKGVSDSSLKWLYMPGTIPFILVALLCFFIQPSLKGQMGAAWKETIIKMKAPCITLCSSVALVTIFKNSGGTVVLGALGPDFVKALPDYLFFNTTTHVDISAATAVAAAFKGGPTMLSIPLAFATSISGIANGVVPWVSYWIGALGAFITGSNTVSDQMFGAFQWDLAQLKHMPTIVILAAQAVGGAGGNMICINNIVAATAVTGLANNEGYIIKRTIWPCIVYSLGCWIICLILLYAVGFIGQLPAAVLQQFPGGVLLHS
jgi:lactate permease